MSTRHLRYLFDPASVVLIGASEQPGSLGAALTRNLLDGGFKGELFLVNRRHRRVLKRPAYPHLAALPGVPELAIIATPTPAVTELLAELGRIGSKVALIATPSEAHDSQKTRLTHQSLREVAHSHGVRLLGPDSFGVIAPRHGLNASLVHLPPRPGHLALVVQSGAVLAPMIEWATVQGIGFSCIVALGERADIDFNDLLDWLVRDPDTHAILLYLETLKRARPFLSAARATARVKPVLVVRAGRGGDAASHLTDAIYDAAFRRVGILRLRSLRELFWAAETLTHDLPATGDRLAILGNSRGLGLLAADTLLAEGGRLARFSREAEIAIRAMLPAGTAPENPLDLGQDAGPDRVAAVLDVLLRERDLDGVLIFHSPNARVSVAAIAAAVIETMDRFRAHGESRPRVLTCWWGADRVQSARQRFLERRIPTYDTPEDAIRAFLRRWHYQEDRLALMETPPEISELLDPDPAIVRPILERVRRMDCGVLNAIDTVALLQAYHIPMVVPEMVLGMRSADAAPLELSIRVINDPVFGPTLLLGLGGRAADQVHEVAVALPPLNLVLAREAIKHTPMGQLLRNADAVMVGLLNGVLLLLVKISRLIVDLSEIIEVELNPVLADATGATVGAARIRLAAATAPVHERLAIRPYPRELEETLPLPDGSTLLIRPVRPEDEPAFIAGFARLTTEDVRMRFMHVIKELNHDEAARLTQIDYDREMALVAFRQRPDRPLESCGVARFSADPDGDRAEFAIILLRDATGIGLSSLLLRRLIQYARARGFHELYGEILRENEPMLELCRAMGFALKACPEDAEVVIAALPLVSE